MSLVEAVDVIQSRYSGKPTVGVVLGSGLGAFADTLENRVEIPYGEIPGWARSTAVGHAGRLVLGSIGSTEVAVMSGRNHLYEGYSVQQVAFGVRVMAKLGVRSLALTNAAGGVNLGYHPGQLVLISDHINLLGANPLSGPNDDTLGPRFPDMTEAYSGRLRVIAKEVGLGLGLDLAEGVYAAVPGPSYETPAEIRYLRAIGADLVGMSTIPETIAAQHMGLEVLAISCVTNMAAGVTAQKLVHEEVLETGARVRDTLVELLRQSVVRF